VRAVSKKPKEAGFEQTLAELEALVGQMESGELPLEEALRNFERGVQLTRECQSALLAAQQKVQLLAQKSGGPAPEDFSPDAEPADDAER
jgi:exodeoxyribonuclease VII small subunit